MIKRKQKKICWFRAVTGESSDRDECTRKLAYGGCEKCYFYMENLPKPEPGHENDQDELPD